MKTLYRTKKEALECLENNPLLCPTWKEEDRTMCAIYYNGKRWIEEVGKKIDWSKR